MLRASLIGSCLPCHIAALYYYHFPAITGVNIDPLELILQMEEIGVPTFRGMKFTEFNLW